MNLQIYSNEVKAWRDEKQKYKISFKETFERQEMESKEKMHKEVIKVLQIKENSQRRSRKEKECNIWIKR